MAWKNTCSTFGYIFRICRCCFWFFFPASEGGAFGQYFPASEGGASGQYFPASEDGAFGQYFPASGGGASGQYFPASEDGAFGQYFSASEDGAFGQYFPASELKVARLVSCVSRGPSNRTFLSNQFGAFASRDPLIPSKFSSA